MKVNASIVLFALVDSLLVSTEGLSVQSVRKRALFALSTDGRRNLHSMVHDDQSTTFQDESDEEGVLSGHLPTTGISVAVEAVSCYCF